MNNLSTKDKRRLFKERLQHGPIVIAPGCYDAFSVKLVEFVGFEAVYMTGAGVSAGLVGMPDVGLLTMTEMVEQARRISDATGLPIISDADTGYGGPLNVRRTVEQFERTGACAIHLEDQEIPKKCGHLEGKRVISAGRMVDRLKASLDARPDENFLIIARTDARATHGLDEALDRGRLYAETGADVIFIEAPESVDEVEEIGRRFKDVPLLMNRGGGGKTPALSAAELERMGFQIVIFPGDLQKAAGKAMIEILSILKETGNTDSAQAMMMSFEERFEILGLSRFRELESLYSRDEGP
jgi:2-methylisocitrate lyase-like PEP mutase family enzyme